MTNSASRREFLSRSAQAAGGASMLAAATVNGAEAPREFRVRQRFTTDLKRPRKLAVQGDLIHVAGDCEVRTFDAQGTLLRQHAFERPVRCVTVDSRELLVVGLLNKVICFNPQVKEVARWSAPKGTVLSSLAATKNEILGADAGAGVVWRWDREGRLLGKISREAKFAAPVEFFQVVADGSRVHVNNPSRHRIETFTAHGEHQGQWGGHSRDLAGFSGCCNPVSFALLSSGEFVTAERGTPRVKHFTADGRFVQEVCGPDGFTENAFASAGDQKPACHAGGLDVAVNDRDQIVVLDRVTGTVKVLAVG